MFLDHNNVDRLGVLESEESESSRSSGAAVPHDCTLGDLAELGEVVSKRFYRPVSTKDIYVASLACHTIGSLPIKTPNKHLATNTLWLANEAFPNMAGKLIIVTMCGDVSSVWVGEKIIVVDLDATVLTRLAKRTQAGQ